MELTRDYKQTVASRVERDPEFARELRNEVTSLFLNGEEEIAQIILHDLFTAKLEDSEDSID